MKNGYVVLGILALLFLSMYGYAYFSVLAEKMRHKKQMKLEMEKEELRRQESIRKQEIINEKVARFNKRKEEIQHELMLLEKMKEKLKVG
jgi:hypothetical protein